jgi:hypothetical protein
MRPVHLTDLDAAVRALLIDPECDWPMLAGDLVQNTRIADRFRKRLRKAHPVFGNGSLSSAVSRKEKSPPQACDARYRRCLLVLLTALS